MRRLISLFLSAGVFVGILAVRPAAQQANAAAGGANRNIVRISKYIISVSDSER